MAPYLTGNSKKNLFDLVLFIFLNFLHHLVIKAIFHADLLQIIQKDAEKSNEPFFERKQDRALRACTFQIK